ncbi:MAG: NAD(P)H-binding protein [Weeksellaceae bacterium]|nr:NAD(P)H-binding protein [Weeksellaceae bacterium]
MKKVLIIGASGSLAQYVIEALKEVSNVELTLFARNKNRISNTANAIVIEGDAENFNDLKNAVTGKDIVYVNLAGNLDEYSKNIIHAMKEIGVKRVIAISSIGIFDEPLKSVLKPYRALSDNFENSGLEYTILRPDWFTNGNEIDYQITHKGEPEKGGAISRKSIADFVKKLVENPEKFIGENLGISKV